MDFQDPRPHFIQQASTQDAVWDVIVVGGGASGLSAAWDAVSRGLKVALLERDDFAKSTSSRSTKLVHGGVRYLQKLELGLVREALRERRLLLENAPEFCRQLDFVLPCKHWVGKWYYRIGLWLYDFLGQSGQQTVSHFKKSRIMSRAEVSACMPSLQNLGSGGGVLYSDAQFDDAGLAVALAQVINGTEASEGEKSLALNYASVEGMRLEDGFYVVDVEDREGEHSWQMKGKVLINATGIFADVFRDSMGLEKRWKMQTSRGAHIVCAGDFLDGNKALIVPKTSDGRVMFAIPWMGKTVIGTTDEATDEPVADPVPSKEELEFLLRESGIALGVKASDVVSTWAGLRPLVKKARDDGKETKSLSRKHIVEVSENGVVSLLGGKWTTARAMGEDVMDVALELHQDKFDHPVSQSATEERKLIEYGALMPLSSQQTERCVVREAVIFYYARTIEDVVARRMRTLFLDAQQAIDKADSVSRTMADVLGWSEDKRKRELDTFVKVAERYLP